MSLFSSQVLEIFLCPSAGDYIFELIFDDLFEEHTNFKTILLSCKMFKDLCILKERQKNAMGRYISYVKHKTKNYGDLFKYGVVVYPIDPDVHENLSSRFMDSLKTMPEYRDDVEIEKYVQGSFGALGNPSSFHGEYEREARAEFKRAFDVHVAEYVIDKYHWTEGIDKINSCVLFDRKCVRKGKVSAEMAHRDITNVKLPRSLPNGDEDVVFGGFVNLNGKGGKCQSFAGVLGTHADPKPKDAKGFSTFTREEIKKMKIKERINAQQDFNDPRSGLSTNEKGHIVVPPGHGVAFFQTIIHEVVSGSDSKEPDQRMFVGHYLSSTNRPLFENVLEWCENGSTPKIPSGQLPALWPKIFESAWFNRKTGSVKTLETAKRLMEFGEKTFKFVCLQKQETKDGQTYYTPGNMKDRILPSLKELGMWNKSFEYTKRDKQILLPMKVIAKRNLYKIFCKMKGI